MKRKLLTFVLALALVIGLVPVTGIQAATQGEVDDAESKKYPLHEVTISVGEKLYLYELEDILWDEYDISISLLWLDEDVRLLNSDKAVTATMDGVYIDYLTGKKAGIAYIRSMRKKEYVTDSIGERHNVYVTVKINVVDTSMTKDNTGYIQLVNGGKTMKANIADVSGSATYKSSNKKVFKVSKKGNLTPVAPGVATLTVKSGGNTYKAEVRVINKGLKYSGTTVTGIGKCKDTKIVIGRYTEDGKKTIDTIGKGAFKGSKITSVSIPSTVKTIKENAFDKCKSIKSITIPDGVKKVYCTFKSTGITEVTFPSSVTDVKAPLANNVKTINLTTLDQFEAFCNYGTIDEAYRTVITYNNKEYHTLTGGLPEYTPYLMGYKSEERLSDKQKSELTVLRAVDFRPDQDSFNVKLFKADLVVTSLLSKVSYGMDTTRTGKGKDFSNTVFALIGGYKRSNGLGFVCDEYANTTDRFFKLFGLPSTTKTSTNHRWQEVRLSDGKWYDRDNVKQKHANVYPYFDAALEEIGGIKTARTYVENIANYGGLIKGFTNMPGGTWASSGWFDSEDEYESRLYDGLKFQYIGDCEKGKGSLLYIGEGTIMEKGDTF